MGKWSYDSGLMPGASNAINVCLKVASGERATLITDLQTQEIAAALADQIERAGAELRIYTLESLTQRPLSTMPGPVLEALSGSAVSIFAAQALEGELPSRMEMMAVVNANRIRHGHMVNITEQIMREGMCADFAWVDELSGRLIEQARAAQSIRGVTPAGTDIRASFSPDLKWIKTSGIIGPDKWGNLPGGEIFTSPARVDGCFVADGVVGDYLCGKFGDLRNNPLQIDIEDSRIVDVNCDNKTLLEEFRRYTSTDENSNRVGEFAIGTNLSVGDVIGNILQDEKIPGIHLAFGHPYSEHTGQSWVSTTHIDCVGRQFDIWIDDRQIMRQGQFTL